MMRVLRGIDLAEVVAQRVVGDLAQRAGQLRASGPAADDHERHPRAQLFRIRFAFGGFKRQKNPAAHRRGVVHGFQAGRELLPFVVAEILVARAGGDDRACRSRPRRR